VDLEFLVSDWLTQKKDCHRHCGRSMINSNVLVAALGEFNTEARQNLVDTKAKDDI